MTQTVQKQSDSELSIPYFNCKVHISDNTFSKVQVLKSQTSYNSRMIPTLSEADTELLWAERENWHLRSLRGEGEV